MSKEKCEEVMNTYLSLDKDERVPFTVTAHLLACKKCRTQVRMLTLAERIVAAPLKIQVPLNDMAITAIMQKINPAWDPETCSTNPVSLRKWVAGGAAMILFMLVFGFLTTSTCNESLLFAFYLVFAGVVTAYCALFIASNLDFFIKKMQTLNFVP
jgi:hypothetical protein